MNDEQRETIARAIGSARAARDAAALARTVPNGLHGDTPDDADDVARAVDALDAAVGLLGQADAQLSIARALLGFAKTHPPRVHSC